MLVREEDILVCKEIRTYLCSSEPMSVTPFAARRFRTALQRVVSSTSARPQKASSMLCSRIVFD